MGEIIEMIPENEAVTKLKVEVNKITSKMVPVIPISNHLIKQCTADEEFKNLILIEHKTLEKCCKHVEKKAKEKLKSQSGWIEDSEVFEWAEDYYRLDDAEIERQEEEKRQIAVEERKKRKEEEQKKPKETKETKETKKVKKIPESSQMTLFDF